MKTFSINIAIIIITFSLLFVTSILLENNFIKALVVRQIIIYLLMLIEIFIAIRIFLIINTKKSNV